MGGRGGRAQPSAGSAIREGRPPAAPGAGGAHPDTRPRGKAAPGPWAVAHSSGPPEENSDSGSWVDQSRAINHLRKQSPRVRVRGVANQPTGFPFPHAVTVRDLTRDSRPVTAPNPRPRIGIASAGGRRGAPNPHPGRCKATADTRIRRREPWRHPPRSSPPSAASPSPPRAPAAPPLPPAEGSPDSRPGVAAAAAHARSPNQVTTRARPSSTPSSSGRPSRRRSRSGSSRWWARCSASSGSGRPSSRSRCKSSRRK